MLEQRIQQQFFEGADLQYQTAEALARPIADAVNAIVSALTAGGKLLLCGQGGGALLGRHGAELMVGRLERDRPPLAALSIAPEPRVIQALGLPGDLLLLIDPAAGDLDASMAAIRTAQGKDMTVVLLVGASAAGLRETLAETDVLINVPHERTSRVLEAQLLVLHALCDAVDVQLMGDQE
ncbi:MAG: SIS domain-containing protein [Rubrivivax sp.]|mgnify:CR=1 FL=1|jgi:D-sedoheptulose 7-phosphate isomerase|nr:SIS domain-containing protein [Rubrivivax sp.]MBK8527945.1 SIS domain-containing protein [Rubrivivax sp.]